MRRYQWISALLLTTGISSGLILISCGQGLVPLSGGGLLSFSSGSISFAVQLSGEAADQTLSLTNSGRSPATGVQASFTSRASAFGFKGGSFPGTGGTCAETIPSGATCTIVIAFSYSQSGEYSGSLSLTYDGGQSSISLSGTIRAGGYDSTFGAGGYNTYNISTGSDYIDAMVVQPDGKVVAGGPPFDGTGNDEFVVARYLTTGFLDPTFGVNGVATMAITTGNEHLRDIALQTDGKILLTGSTNFNGPAASRDFTVARLTSNGVVDTTFGGGNGIAAVSVSAGADQSTRLAVQSDGRILAAGAASSAGGNLLALVRFTTDGLIDSSFDSDGIWTQSLGTGGASFADLLIQPDGKILGYGSKRITLFDYDHVIFRFLTDGSLDSTFGAGTGFLTNSFSTIDEFARSLLLQTDGKMIVTSYALQMARYLTDGTIDPTFGAAGMVTTAYFSDFSSSWYSALQSDGKILTTGVTFSEGFIARFHTDGTFDTSFGTDGVRVLSALTGGGARVVEQNPDGSLMVGGWRHTPDDMYAVLKLLP